ncbi:hypothetical protein HK57_00663 [Aspergillus ustus]|uniref:Uncharacterized protein n=1 Tax=Aspergillus ustus TaxID=40382 RepID=A0A0C1C3F2_ASPUT|nr:hypothetical protein HK57_00663 [Aspergillus ustus]
MFGTDPLATTAFAAGATDGGSESKNKSLWQMAFDDLSHTDRRTLAEYEAYLLSPNPGILDDLRAKIHKEEEAYAQRKLRLKFKGHEIALSEICRKILNYLDQFLIIGDIIIEYDPGHTAIPWAIIRGFVKMAQNIGGSAGAVVDGLERLSAVITRFSLVETELARKKYAIASDLINSMARLYTAILAYMASAKRFYDTNSLGARAVAGMINRVQSEMDSAWKIIADKEEDAWKLRLMLRDQRFDEQLGLLQVPTQNSRPSRQHILRWIDAIYTDSSYELALETRLQGTCQWIFKNSAFQSWLTPDSTAAKLFWLRAGPGYGKTILSASIIEYIQCLPERHTAPISPFFFCSADDIFTRDPAAIVRSWVAQLVSQNNDALDIATELSANREGQATGRDIWALYGKLCTGIPNCVFMVDGFDECTDYNKAHIEVKQEFLKNLCQVISPTVRVLIVSREDSQLRSFSTTYIPDRIQMSEYAITADDTEDDISSFAHEIVGERLQGTQRQELIDQTAQRIIDKSEGLFLWIRLISKDISRGKPPKVLARIVEDMPHGLVATYQKEVDEILQLGEYERSRAIDILRWISFANRPLRVEEISEALVIDPDSAEGYPFDELPDTWNEEYTNDQIRRLCRSLVEIRSQSFDSQLAYHTVHFVHSSVRDFLAQSVQGIPRYVNPCAEHKRIARACLHYLLYKELSSDYRFSKEIFQEKLHDFPFLAYAATQWSYHINRSEDSRSVLLPLVKQIFDVSTTAFALWADIFEVLIDNFETTLLSDASQLQRISIVSKSLEIFNSRGPHNTELSRHVCRCGVYLAARLGFPDIMVCALRSWETPPAGYAWALQLAIARRQRHAVEYLLEAGTPPDHRLPFGTAPLLMAAGLDVGPDSEYFVNLLIAAGADVSVANRHGITPLYAAATKGNLPVVIALLSNGATMSNYHSYQRTPLHQAAAGGYNDIIERLIERGVGVNERDVVGLTPVYLAMIERHGHSVRLLIEKGADTSVKKNGVTMLHMTAGWGLGEIADLLITRGIPINGLADDKLATLHYAARAGDLAVAEILIKRGAKINIRGQGRVTPLHLATESDKAEMVQLLLKHGADPNISDSDGLTPFHHSVACGYKDIAILLLAYGADPARRDIFGRTALHLAVQQQQDHMVPSLIDGGAVVDARDDTDMTPLHLAAVVGHTGSAQTMIEKGADILVGTSYSSGRAQKAILAGVDALLARRENARLARALRAAIHLAVEEVQLPHAIRLGIHKVAMTIELTLEVVPSEVFEILRDPDIFLDSGWTPLHIAAYNGREDFVRLMVHHGASVDALTARGLSAIQIAEDRAHRNVVQLLKELGSKIDYSPRNLVEENRVQERARRDLEMRLVSVFAFEEAMADQYLATG